MQITFDTSFDSLDNVLRVLAEAYGVEATIDNVSARSTGTRNGKANARSAKPGPSGSAKPVARARGSVRKAATRPAKERTAAPRRSAKTANVTAGPRTARKRAVRPGGGNVAPVGQSGLIRAWAKKRGLAVGDAGRLSASVIDAYQATHS